MNHKLENRIARLERIIKNEKHRFKSKYVYEAEQQSNNRIELGGYTWTKIGNMKGYPIYLCDEFVQLMAFDGREESNDWEDSDIRKWLNSGFYNTLSTEEKSEISPFEGDRLFLLSEDEYEKFKGNISKMNNWWWLRTSLPDSSSAVAFVHRDGDIDYTYANYPKAGVRPAVLLNVVDREKLDQLLDKIRDAYANYKSLCNDFIDEGGDEDEIDGIIHDINQVL